MKRTESKNMKKYIKKYLTLTRAGMLDMMQWRSHLFITFLGNIIYLIIIYNLWQAIYASSPEDTVNGMTFTDTMIYLVMATAIYNSLSLWIVWDMSNQIQSGEMILNLVRPMSFRSNMLFSCLGANIMSFIMIFIPTFAIVRVMTGSAIPLGMNLVYFIIAISFALLINFYIDFFVGTICLYTESTWGVDSAKNVVVMLLSGAVIPLAFFPEKFRVIAEYLPFQAIYNIPLRILTGHASTFEEILPMYAVQIFWIVFMYIAGGLFWRKSIPMHF